MSRPRIDADVRIEVLAHWGDDGEVEHIVAQVWLAGRVNSGFGPTAEAAVAQALERHVDYLRDGATELPPSVEEDDR